MALDHSRLLAAASLTAALCGVSCSTSSDSTATTPAGDANPAGPGSTPAAAAAPVGVPTEAQGQGQDPDLAQQRRAALAAKFLQNGRDLRADGKLDAALLELLRARELAPANEEVLALIRAIQAEQGKPAGMAINYHDEQVRLARIAEERNRAMILQRLQDARGKLQESNFQGAVEDMRLARLEIEANDQTDWGNLPEQVRALGEDVERRLEEQTRSKAAELNERLAARLREEEAAKTARRRSQVDTLLQESQRAYLARRFQYSQDLALKALELEPNNAIAFEMNTAAGKAARDESSEEYYKEMAKEIRAMVEAHEDLRRPQTAVIELDAETWSTAQRRAGKLAPEAVMDPADQDAWRKVRTGQVGKLSYTEETGTYADVVKNLSLITGVPIILTPEARTLIEGENLKVVLELVASITLENFLNHMISRSPNLAWTVRNGTVIIGDKTTAGGTRFTKVLSVKDLIFAKTEFIAPRIRDIPGSDSGDDETPRTGGEGEEKTSIIPLDQLVTTLKNATDPKYWDGVENQSITPEDNGYLVISADANMHAMVAETLAAMRKATTPVVTMDSKFLTVTRNFLQEVGVDFRGLGGTGNKGAVPSLDDVTNGLQSNASSGQDNGGTQDQAANPLAGAFFNDGGDGDIRARTEGLFNTDLGKALSPRGGLTASWTLLDDLQLNAILRAIEKQENAEVVNSQTLSVMDKERGHVAVINQTAYVRDFDVEVAQASFIADPKVDVIQDGLVLDVKPVIQHDRKYITLELTPTVAELTRPIPTFTTSLAGSTLPVTLQLPDLTVTTFATTAKVPDGGSVLLGGLRQALSKERRAEVPLLARLPLISFLFKQEGVADENRSLMVMVKATITDIRDEAAGK
ncbi:MAG: hypothetical protein IPK26_11910 [Planctomycetes bacterium]|nr:hypothetical protein [Planctomycetota bacterium]